MAHATAFFNRETTHFNGCSFFILNSDYKTLQQYMDSILYSSIWTQSSQEEHRPRRGVISIVASLPKMDK